VEIVAHQLLLAVAVGALAGAGFRMASRLTPRGLERVVAAAPLAVGLAVLWSLGLGLLELGASPAALALSAVATWLAVRAVLPAPEIAPSVEIAGWWRALGTAGRAGAGAVAAAVAAYASFVLRHPQLGIDAVTNHLGDVVGWTANGRPGSVVELQYGLPFGNYPQATETVLTWGSALSRSFVWAGLWSLATVLLLAAAGWVGVRALGAGRAVAALAIAAVCTSPLVADGARTPGTDLPALAWLVTAGALVAASTRRPALLAPALVGAGLAIGTKTTAAPLVLVVLALAGVTHRRRLREHRDLLLGAGLAALVVGGTWYVRNWIGRGSPLWPLVSLPGGDPLPPLIDALDYSLLDRPDATLRGNLDVYEEKLAGFLALFAAAVLAPLAVRRRSVVLAAGATALALILWLNAPFTGRGDLALTGPYLSAVRYLLPAAAAAVTCLVLAAERGGRGARAAALGALVAAIGWNLLHTLDLGYPVTPSAALVLGGAGAGALLAAALSRVRPGAALVRVGAGAAAVLAVAGAALATDGYVERHSRANRGDARVPFAEIAGVLAAREDFQDGSQPVAVAPVVSAMLAGDTLAHEVELIPRDEPCAQIEARATTGWVVIADVRNEVIPPYTALDCFRGRAPVLEADGYRVYRD
jgi:hypothetical protein